MAAPGNASSGAWIGRTLSADERGSALVQTVLIVGCIALIAAAGFRMFGESISNAVQVQGDAISGINSSTDGVSGVEVAMNGNGRGADGTDRSAGADRSASGADRSASGADRSGGSARGAGRTGQGRGAGDDDVTGVDNTGRSGTEVASNTGHGVGSGRDGTQASGSGAQARAGAGTPGAGTPGAGSPGSGASQGPSGTKGSRWSGAKEGSTRAAGEVAGVDAEADVGSIIMVGIAVIIGIFLLMMGTRGKKMA